MAEESNGLSPRTRIVGGVLVLAALLSAGRLLTSSNPTGRAAGSPPLGCEQGSFEPLPEDEVVVAEMLAPTLGDGTADTPEIDDAVSGQFVIKLADEDTPNFRRLQNGALRTGRVELDNELEKIELVRPVIRNPRGNGGLERAMVVRTNEDRDTVMARLSAFEDVQYVEPVYRTHGLAVPTDPFYSYQWHFDLIDLPSAHDITDGTGAIVAVLDTGIQPSGVDGFLDFDDGGYNCLDDNTDTSDGHGHGTHVAGTIAQATNNGVGVAGVAPGATVRAYKVLGDDGSGDTAALAECIYKAVDDGANVLNLSLGSSSYSSAVADAMDYAEENGVTVVAASGNDGHSGWIAHPARYATVIAVGAVDANGEVAPYSNQGGGLDIVAPGGDTTSDTDGDGYPDGVLQQTYSGGSWSYSFYQGTSMATPHVAGVAALLYSAGLTDPLEIRVALESTAQDLGKNGFDWSYGYGLVDPVAALEFEMPTEDLERTSLTSSPTSATWHKIQMTTNRACKAFIVVDDAQRWKKESTSFTWYVKTLGEEFSVKTVIIDEYGDRHPKWVKLEQPD